MSQTSGTPRATVCSLQASLPQGRALPSLLTGSPAHSTAARLPVPLGDQSVCELSLGSRFPFHPRLAVALGPRCWSQEPPPAGGRLPSCFQACRKPWLDCAVKPFLAAPSPGGPHTQFSTLKMIVAGHASLPSVGTQPGALLPCSGPAFPGLAL